MLTLVLLHDELHVHVRSNLEKEAVAQLAQRLQRLRHAPACLTFGHTPALCVPQTSSPAAIASSSPAVSSSSGMVTPVRDSQRGACKKNEERNSERDNETPQRKTRLSGCGSGCGNRDAGAGRLCRSALQISGTTSREQREANAALRRALALHTTTGLLIPAHRKTRPFRARSPSGLIFITPGLLMSHMIAL